MEPGHIIQAHGSHNEKMLALTSADKRVRIWELD